MTAPLATQMPVAIVGTAFRLPGDLQDEEAFWQVLINGLDQVREVSAERWPVTELQHPARNEPGRSVSFRAGMLSNVESFDAAFFGISPREAAWMDPQQRLLLELAWEAMENAGCPPSRLAGSDCAVYVGISGLDYGMRRLDDLSSLTAHTMTGNTLSIAANRLSYVFDLRGPSLAVDTACSSSLVALHHACMAIERGEASTALVGGVNLLLHPYPFVGFTKAAMLSEHGRCATFAANADGYVRAEGAVVLLLKPLHHALADGDPIEAVIRATGVNADGARKSGLTIPSLEGQTELMRRVLARSGLDAADIDYIEAHGTGTPIGDPVEAAAIGAVYGRARDAAQPLPVGSVKTNLGHLEAASGLAGLLKAMQVLKRGTVPPSLHAAERNPRIDFANLRLDAVSQATPLPCGDSHPGPRRAGVNSFGFGGANAHVLLEEYLPARVRHATVSGSETRGPGTESPPTLRASGRDPSTVPDMPLLLSAATPEALRAWAARLASWLRAGGDRGVRPDRLDMARACALERNWLPHRLAVPAHAPDWADTLETFAQGHGAVQAWHEQALPQGGGVAMVYSGNGAQWPGMASRLLVESPGFRRRMAELDAAMAPSCGFSVLAELENEVDAARLADTAVAQPLLFAIQVVLTGMLRDEGVVVQAVLGHSVGEVSAAWACGALSLEQAIQVICARSSAQALTAGYGRMAALSCDPDSAQALFAQSGARALELAAFNAPAAVTVSGPLPELKALQSACRAAGKVFKLLDLDYAFHSAAMDAVRERLLADLEGLTPRGEGLSALFVSSVSGQCESGTLLDARYWWRNVREPVRFAEGVQALLAQGCRVLLEVGPSAILQRYLNDGAQEAKVQVRVLPTLTRTDDSAERLVEAALRIALQQGPAALADRFPQDAARVRLPNYPWQRELHRAAASAESAGLLARRRVHPLLGWRLHDVEAGWENVLDLRTQPWLKDHVVGGAVVLAGASYVELLLAAVREWTGQAACRLENLDILAPLVLEADHGRVLRVDLDPGDFGLRVRSRQRLSDSPWTLHVVARLAGAPAPPGLPPLPMDETANGACITRAQLYPLAAALGLDYGPNFRAFESGRHGDSLLTGELRLEADGAADGMHLPPGLLDACFQSLLAFFSVEIETGQALPLLPVRVGELHFRGGTATVRRFRTVLKRRSPTSVAADFELQSATGEPVAWLKGCRFRAATLRHTRAALPATWEHVLRVAPLASSQRSVTWPATAGLAQTLRDWQVEQEGRLRRSEFHATAVPLFDALVVSAAYHAARQLTAQAPEAARALFEGASTGDDDNDALRTWVLGLLRQQELLAGEGAHAALAESDLPAAEEIWRTLLRDFPGSLQELVRIGRIVVRLPELLAGRVRAGPLAAELAASPQVETLHESSAAYAGNFQALAVLLRTLCQRPMPGRRLRVLELVPASGGYLATTLADLADGSAIDYVITHRDPSLCARVADDARELHFVRVVPMEPGGQAFPDGSAIPERFDVVVARHSLHRCEHPVSVLAWLHSLLAAGGLLVLAERNPDLAVDLQGGLAASWWRPAQGGGVASRLDGRETWRRLLEAQGFVDVHEVLECGGEQELGGCFLLLSKRAAELQAGAQSSPTGGAPQRWCLLCADKESRATAERLSDLLVAQSHLALVTDLAGAEATDAVVQALAGAERKLGILDHVVDLRFLGLDPAGDTGGSSLARRTACGPALELVQALRSGERAPMRLWWCTRGAAPVVGSASTDPRQALHAALWGLGRVLSNEWPEARCTLVDVGSSTPSGALPALLAAELLENDGEREVVYTARGRHALRLRRHEFPSPSAAAAAAPRGFRLRFRVPGQLRNLEWCERKERPLADDQVEVRTVAAGLNFRDVMYAMGLLPDEAVENGFAGATLGLEFAGVVMRTGRKVTHVEVGDAVLGFAPACFADRVVTSGSAVTGKPEGWSFESAATVPTVFFTVYYALRQLANVQPGERVLVHGAAGGVGIAAVELALHLKAEVYATAGSEERRDFVRLLGADHVYDSRSTTFADEILAATEGQGVDVILNSLAGGAMRRNLQILKPFGRFLELGKRDFYENTTIGLRPFKDNISYFGIDADQLLVARPQQAGRLLREVMALFRTGVLTPLPYRAFPADRVVEAFRFMRQSRQIGKVVVSIEDAPRSVQQEHRTDTAFLLRRDRSYLVTGGLEGFGLETARWLARRGAGTLVLAGRRGMETPGAAQAARELGGLGSHVAVLACDVTERDQVAGLLARVARDLPPLAGIVHAAMQLDDATLERQDEARLHRVLAPKVAGAWHLHELTINQPLDFFLLYSSITTAIGNPGQANYVAANAALEALALQRQDQGLPGACIAWGPIGDAGYLSRNAQMREQLTQRTGVKTLDSGRALERLGQVLASGTGVVYVADVDWGAMARRLPAVDQPRLAELARDLASSAEDVEGSEAIQALLDGKSPDEIRALVVDLVTREVATILGTGVERIDPTRSLHDLGLDSLMGVELGLGLDKRFGLQLPAMLLNEGPSVLRVSERIMELLSGNGAGADAAPGTGLTALVTQLAVQHGEQVTEAEIQATAADVQKAGGHA